MNILHFSTSDVEGGAAKAAFQIHRGLESAGHRSTMVVQKKVSDDPTVHQTSSLAPTLAHRMKHRLPFLQEEIPKTAYTFNLNRKQNIDTRLFYSYPPQEIDIVCLHWITDLLSVRDIRQIADFYRSPIIWNLMDQAPLTGGCHYAFDCDGFTKQCGFCPQLTPHGENDRSRLIWQEKYNLLSKLPLIFIPHTQWTAARIRESSLFHNHRVELIPLPIDTTIFRPFDQSNARDLLHIPQDKKVIFFGAADLADERKGMQHLVEALRQLPGMMNQRRKSFANSEIYLLVAGQGKGDLLDALPFAGQHLGLIKEDLVLALAYQAADLFVCPSIFDAGPMMIPESMLCGTPVVAFDAGGAPDLIVSMQTGYLAAFKDAADLAHGIAALLHLDDLRPIRKAAAEVAAAHHAPAVVMSKHLKLFNSTMSHHPHSDKL